MVILFANFEAGSDRHIPSVGELVDKSLDCVGSCLRGREEAFLIT